MGDGREPVFEWVDLVWLAVLAPAVAAAVIGVTSGIVPLVPFVVGVVACLALRKRMLPALLAGLATMLAVRALL